MIDTPQRSRGPSVRSVVKALAGLVGFRIGEDASPPGAQADYL